MVLLFVINKIYETRLVCGSPLLSSTKRRCNETGKTNKAIIEVSKAKTADRNRGVKDIPKKLNVGSLLFCQNLLQRSHILLTGVGKQSSFLGRGNLVSSERIDNVCQHAEKPETGSDLIESRRMGELKNLSGVDPGNGISRKVNGVGDGSQESGDPEDRIIGLVGKSRSSGLYEIEWFASSKKLSGKSDSGLQMLPEVHSLLGGTLSK